MRTKRQITGRVIRFLRKSPVHLILLAAVSYTHLRAHET